MAKYFLSTQIELQIRGCGQTLLQLHTFDQVTTFYDNWKKNKDITIGKKIRISLTKYQPHVLPMTTVEHAAVL